MRALPGNPRHRPWIVMANSAATSRGGGLKAVEAVLRRAGIHHHSHVTSTALAGAKLAREYANRKVVFAVLGGDGTVNNAAAQMLGGQAWFAALPGGMENLMSRETGLPADPALAADCLIKGRIVPWDAGFLGGRPFLMIAGVGFDGVVCAETGGIAKSMFRHAAYAATIARLIFTPTPVFSIRWNGHRMRECVQAAFCNGALYGGGFKVAPKADPGDGVLDMAVFPFMGHLQRGIQVTAAMLSKKDRTRHFSRHRLRTASITARRTLPAQVDGEAFQTRNPEVTIRKGALKVVVCREG